MQPVGIPPHILAEESLVEVVVTCRNRGVNGIETGSANQFESLVEVQSVFLHVVTQTLQVAECSMTLVAMINIFLDAQSLQQQHATDAKQNLLLKAVLPVATIESVGDRPVELGIHVIVGIEQVELHATDVYSPYKGMHMVIGVRNINDQLVAIFVQLALDRQRTEVLCLIVSNLLTVH